MRRSPHLPPHQCLQWHSRSASVSQSRVHAGVMRMIEHEPNRAKWEPRAGNSKQPKDRLGEAMVRVAGPIINECADPGFARICSEAAAVSLAHPLELSDCTQWSPEVASNCVAKLTKLGFSLYSLSPHDVDTFLGGHTQSPSCETSL